MNQPSNNSPTVPPDGRPAQQQPAWRQDFPIDWPQDHYVARRDFTKFLGLTSLAFVIGQLWIGVKSWWDSQQPAPGERFVARLDDLAVGAALVFHYPEDSSPCLLMRTSEQTLLAYSQSCTHLACAVVPEMEQGKLHCPCHHGYFDLHSGRAIQGPPRRPLPRITLAVRQGRIYATGVEVEPT